MTGKRPRVVIIDDPFVTSREQAERMARRYHGTDGPDLADAFAHMASGNPYARRPDVTDPPWEFSARSAGPAGASYVAEIITDPNDRRGFDARPVGAS